MQNDEEQTLDDVQLPPFIGNIVSIRVKFV